MPKLELEYCNPFPEDGPATVLAVKKDGQFLRDNHAIESYF